jgi:hypothetical protein
MLDRIRWRLRAPKQSDDQAVNMGLDAGWNSRKEFEENVRHIRSLGFQIPEPGLRYAVWVELSVIWAVAFRFAAATSNTEAVLDRIFAGFQSALSREVAVEIPSTSQHALNYDADVADVAEAVWDAMQLPQERIGWEVGKIVTRWYSQFDPSRSAGSKSETVEVMSSIGIRSFGAIVACGKFVRTISQMPTPPDSVM